MADSSLLGSVAPDLIAQGPLPNFVAEFTPMAESGLLGSLAPAAGETAAGAAGAAASEAAMPDLIAQGPLPKFAAQFHPMAGESTLLGKAGNAALKFGQFSALAKASGMFPEQRQRPQLQMPSGGAMPITSVPPAQVLAQAFPTQVIDEETRRRMMRERMRYSSYG